MLIVSCKTDKSSPPTQDFYIKCDTLFNDEKNNYIILYSIENNIVKKYEVKNNDVIQEFINIKPNLNRTIRRHSSGALASISYEDSTGHPLGIWRIYHENGNLYMSGQYCSENECSENRNYSSGFLYSHCFDGEWRYYHDNNKLKRVEHYEQGDSILIWYEYDTLGNIVWKKKFN